MEKYAPAVTAGLASLTRLKFELKEEPFEDSPDRVWPKFARGVFSGIADNAKPQPGACSAYFIIGRVYKLLGAREAYERVLRSMIAHKPITLEEEGATASSGLDLLCVVARNGNSTDVKEIINRIFSAFRESRMPSGKLVLQLLFEPLDASLKSGELSKENYGMVLNVLDQSMDTLPGVNISWWRAGIYQRKAGLDGVTTEDAYNPALLVRAMEYALVSDNYDVLRDVGHQLGFKHYHRATSIEHLALIHLAVVLGISNDGGDIARLETVGSNIVNLWNKISYRSLRECDLFYWHNLRDRIKSVVAITPTDLHAPIAILLIIAVNHEKKNARYDSARRWATERLRGQKDRIPQDDYEYIEKYFV